MPRTAKSSSPNPRFGLFIAALLLFSFPSFFLTGCRKSVNPDPSSLTLIIAERTPQSAPPFRRRTNAAHFERLAASK
jgi:hypothetical protein